MGCPTCSSEPLCQCLLEDPDGNRVAGGGTSANPLIVPSTAVVTSIRGIVTLTEDGVAEQRATYTLAGGTVLSAAGEAAVTVEQGTGLGTHVGQPPANTHAGGVVGTFQLPGRIWVVVIFAVAFPAVPRGVVITRTRSGLVGGPAGQPMYVNEITAARFRVELQGAGSGTGGQFSYMVVR